ncbi:hypothetical protein [Alteribacillus bidgolensis]|uniref:Uncharacterized protein n=1 Tax=Alteribacillus bidgolensis TaxID=930129 RepID=A0A1G8MK16_9BACI|nr:hypothetical protein [Alteribacillus bidgolensis]SDI68194.1 hypothetical protein SAMN05216352_11072 [Alteribacillus bidgolensis]
MIILNNNIYKQPPVTNTEIAYTGGLTSSIGTYLAKVPHYRVHTSSPSTDKHASKTTECMLSYLLKNLIQQQICGPGQD